MKKKLLIFLLAIFFQVSCVAKPIEFNTIIALTMGDRACYVDFTDKDGKRYVEMTDFEICEQKALVNRQVIFTYTKENVMAAECQGNPECTKSETVNWISSIKTIDK